MTPLVTSPRVSLVNDTPGGVRDWNFPPTGEHTKFSLSTWECANPILRRNRDGIFPHDRRSRSWRKRKFPHESRKAHYIFPMNGLAGIVKINFPMSGEAANGE